MSDKEKIESLLERLQAKDADDYAHSIRVRDLTKKFVEKLDISDEEKQLITTASALHDIGILEMDDYLLKKADRLSFDEYEQIKLHAEKSDEIIKELDCYEKIKPIIRHHHENVNGFGYPDSLESDEIPIGSRIIHIVEAYDTMTKGRKNRKAVFDKNKAAADLKEYSGRIYDKALVEKFLALIPEIE